MLEVHICRPQRRQEVQKRHNVGIANAIRLTITGLHLYNCV
jgi:hypothetical protein